MPYSIETEDGIVIDDIPDDIQPDDQRLKDRVAAERAKLAPIPAPIPAIPAIPAQPTEDEALAVEVAAGRAELPEGAELVEFHDPTAPDGKGFRIDRERGIGEVAAGVGEAALALGTGATGGTIGIMAGTLKGIADSIRAGKFGTEEGARMIEKTAEDLMASLTYQPRGEAGREYVAEIGEALAPLEAFAPLEAEIGAATRAARAAIPKRIPTAIKKKVPPRPKPTPEVEAQKIGTLINKAASEGMGSAKAKEQLAEAARINPGAKAAADRMGIDLPADVWSDSQMVKEAAGLTRSIAGSEASSAWREGIINAADKADDAIRTIDASTDIASISKDVISSLSDVRNKMHLQAKNIYKSVDNAVPRREQVFLGNLQKTLDDIVSEVGEAGLSTQEKKLIAMLKEEDITYGRLLREKSLIGKALENRDSPYGNMDAAALKRLYGAIKEDQLDTVELIGGEDLRANLRLANQITAKQKALEKRIINSFGSENEGSIASLMRRSILQSEKGDITALNKLLKIVPKELQKETIAAALMSTTRAKSGIAKGGFGFSEYAKTYEGLRNNAPIYNKIVTILGQDTDKATISNLLTDLYQVSKRITDARANVLTTGKANQAILNAMNAEKLTERIISSTVGKSATTGAAAAVGGAPGAMMASGLMSLLKKAKKDPLAAAGRLFKSDEFNRLATEAATKAKVSEKAVKKFINSPAFKKWQKTIDITIANPELWIMEAFAIQPTQEKEE